MHLPNNTTPTPSPPELLAPAGQPDAGYAALHYGADAVYLGLSRFSARAEAVNFTPDELAEFAAYAHSLTPRRGVYLTLNTVVQQDELAGAAETLLTAAACGVDAVIVQDLGVAAMVRERFPGIRLHSSTQMAIHNLEGALAAKRLGFHRVTLARELTLEEVRRIADVAGVEVETFIHGTLCYSYSGLCLYSSIVGGRSGNRGRCAYTCREAAETPHGRAHLFSLKDMALGPRVRDLAAAGVASLKIEGRKKSPLYVAATVDYYRRILDGKMTAAEAEETEARLKTIFARPWTRLFLDGRHNPDIADPDVVGHRGSPLGTVEKIIRTPAGPGIAFTPNQSVERHDGLQIDLPGEARPYGFPVDALFVREGGRLRADFAAAAGQPLAVPLPEDAPGLAPGLRLYLSSSQAVKRAYPFERPRPGVFGIRLPARFDIRLVRDADDAGQCRIVCGARAAVPAFLRAAAPGLPATLEYEATAAAPAFPARDAAGAEKAARTAFERLGDSIFLLDGWDFDNPDALYIRPGVWNGLRRQVVEGLVSAHTALLADASRELVRFATATPALPATRDADERGGETVGKAHPNSHKQCAVFSPSPPGGGEEENLARRSRNLDAFPSGERSALSWSLCVDHPARLAALTPDDFASMAEIVIVMGGDTDVSWTPALEQIAAMAGRDKIRLASPLLNRQSDGGLAKRVAPYVEGGWRHWLASGLDGWLALSQFPDLDLTADWTLYTLNALAVGELRRLGFSSVTLSPEDDAANTKKLLALYGDRADILVYADLPLFIAAACAHAHVRRCRRGGAPGPDSPCPEAGKPLRIRMERSGDAAVWAASCGSVVTGAPYSLADRLEALAGMGAQKVRVDLRWRPHGPEEVRGIWRNARSGNVSGTTAANFYRGLT